MNSINAFELQDVLIRLISRVETPSLRVLYDYMKLNDVVVEFRLAIDLREE